MVKSSIVVFSRLEAYGLADRTRLVLLSYAHGLVFPYQWSESVQYARVSSLFATLRDDEQFVDDLIQDGSIRLRYYCSALDAR